MRIVIRIDVGRKSRGCTGFGVCSIEIEAELRNMPFAPNQTPGVIDIADDGRSGVLHFTDPGAVLGCCSVPIETFLPFHRADCDGGLTAWVVMPGVYDIVRDSNGGASATVVMGRAVN